MHEERHIAEKGRLSISLKRTTNQADNKCRQIQNYRKYYQKKCVF